MEFNLIEKRWIPVLRRDGAPDWIAPYEVTKDFADNPVVSLNAPRPDFNGALIQFLIGLVQTVAAPQNGTEWRKKLVEPPSPEELQEKFATVRHAFELGGDGPRFMQDMNRSEGKEWEVANLLLDYPGENTLKLDKDHFVKRGGIRSVCPSCCATAIITLQINAPYGGVGHQSSLRGGGPLTTLVLGQKECHDNLWATLWLNILEKNYFESSCANENKTEIKDKFPWMAPTRTSQPTGGNDMTPEDVHPAQMFWSTSRRIVLSLEETGIADCGICGASNITGITKYRANTYGFSYTGAWLHPLSPHRHVNGSPFPVQAEPGGVTYRHWLGLILPDSEKSVFPSQSVHRFQEVRSRSDESCRVWAFGYDMDPNRPTTTRCWYESEMPLNYMQDSIKGVYQDLLARMIRGAKQISDNTRSAVKKAWFKRPGDMKGDMTFVDNSYWQGTEPAFYNALKNLKTALEAGGDGLLAVKEWHAVLCDEALKLFDHHAWNGPVEETDPKRVVIHRKDLQNFNRGKKIKELLGLPIESKAAGKETKKKDSKKQEQVELAS